MKAHRTTARCRAVPACAVALLLAGLAGLPGCGGSDGPGDLLAPVSPTGSGTPGVEAPAAVPAATVPQAASAAGVTDALRPRIVQAPQDATVAPGIVAIFSVRADGPRGLSYQWLRDGDPVEGAVGTSLQVLATEADHLAAFSVDVTAGKITVRSGAARLRVNPS